MKEIRAGIDREHWRRLAEVAVVNRRDWHKERGSYDRSCARRRVGEVGEDRRRLTVE